MYTSRFDIDFEVDAQVCIRSTLEKANWAAFVNKGHECLDANRRIGDVVPAVVVECSCADVLCKSQSKRTWLVRLLSRCAYHADACMHIPLFGSIWRFVALYKFRECSTEVLQPCTVNLIPWESEPLCSRGTADDDVVVNRMTGIGSVVLRQIVSPVVAGVARHYCTICRVVCGQC